jgi:hypothetical protein
MKIGIVGNCQRRSIAASLKFLLPDAQIAFYSFRQLNGDHASRTKVVAELDSCNHIIAQGGGVENGPRSTGALSGTKRSMIMLPPIGFKGFHPDATYINAGGDNIIGPAGAYHSRIALAAYLGDLSAPQAALLFNRFNFVRLGYMRVFAEQIALAEQRLAAFGLDAKSLLARWLQRGCFMHTINHPKIYVVFDIVVATCRAAGLNVDPEAKCPENLHDAMFMGPGLPVFPAIAAKIGIAADERFRLGRKLGSEPEYMDLETFIRECFGLYAAYDPAELAETQGVAEAMEILALKRTVKVPA